MFLPPAYLLGQQSASVPGNLSLPSRGPAASPRGLSIDRPVTANGGANRARTLPQVGVFQPRRGTLEKLLWFPDSLSPSGKGASPSAFLQSQNCQLITNFNEALQALAEIPGPEFDEDSGEGSVFESQTA